MNKMPEIIIIIPVYNEGPVIRNVITGLIKNGYHNIIVIDDGSQENILEKLRGFRLYYVRHAVNLGQGASLQTGFEVAKILGADIIITFDSDGQHNAEDIDILVQPLLNNEYDIAIGSRFINIKKGQIPVLRKLLLKCARWVNYLFTRILLSDAHNGLRALNSKSLHFINLTENRMAHATEILIEIKKYNLRYVEKAVTINYTDYSKENGQSGWDGIKILFDLFLKKVFK
jgi:glycosyltransferase involved in cell wall biosynthesis